MYVTQSIQRPNGINVFGSSLLRVDPDYSSLRFAVSRVAAKPKDAFDETRRGADAVRAALAAMKIDMRDVRSSDLALAEEWVGVNQDRRMSGYRATATFHAFVREFSKVEPVLVAVVDAGADRIHSVHHKTSRMRELRDGRANARDWSGAREGGELRERGGREGRRAAPHRGREPRRLLASLEPHAGRRSRRPRSPRPSRRTPARSSIAGAVMVCFAIINV